MSRLFSKLFRSNHDRGIQPGEAGDGDPHPPNWPSEVKLDGHALIVGSARTGKTTLLIQLAKQAMLEGKALIAIDKDGEFVPALLTQMPRRRIHDVAWLRASDPLAIPGFNVLDVSHGEPAQMIVANLVRTAPDLWGNYWAPDVEEALRISARTLVSANRVLVQRHESQFTLLGIPQLFDLPQFCKKLLYEYVTDREVIQWWSGLLERPSWLNRYDFGALIAPLERLSGGNLECILGQSESALDLRERLKPGRITLFDLRALDWDSKLGAWFGALLADRIQKTILARRPVTPNAREQPVVLAIDSDLSLPGVDEPGLLADLSERGANCLWVKKYVPAVPANATNLFLFGTWRGLARNLVSELGPEFTTDDVADLAAHEFYFRTLGKNRDLVVHRYSTPVPLEIDYVGTQAVQRGLRPRGRAEPAVKGGRERFYARWYHREVTESIQAGRLARAGDSCAES